MTDAEIEERWARIRFILTAVVKDGAEPRQDDLAQLIDDGLLLLQQFCADVHRIAWRDEKP
jgi:hypothetical protein